MVLDRINQANDIKYLNEAQLEELPGEIRQFLIEHKSFCDFSHHYPCGLW